MDRFDVNRNVLRTQSLPRANLFASNLRPYIPSRTQLSLECECPLSHKFKSSTIYHANRNPVARSNSLCSTVADESLGEVVRKFEEVWLKGKSRIRNRSSNSCSSSSSSDGNNFNTFSHHRCFITSTARSTASHQRNRSGHCDHPLSIDSPPDSPPSNANGISCSFHGCTLAETDLRFTSWSRKEQRVTPLTPSSASTSTSLRSGDFRRTKPETIVNCCSHGRLVYSDRVDSLFSDRAAKGFSYAIRRNSSWAGQMQPVMSSSEQRCSFHAKLALAIPAASNNSGHRINCCNSSTSPPMARANSIEPGSESSSSDSSTSHESRKSYVLQPPRSAFASLYSSMGSSFSQQHTRSDSLRRSSTYSIKGLPNTVSTATETDKVIKRDVLTQVIPETYSRGTRTEATITKNVSTWTRGPTVIHQSSQTDSPRKGLSILLADKCVQVESVCECKNKQTEIAVGTSTSLTEAKDAAVDTSDLLSGVYFNNSNCNLYANSTSVQVPVVYVGDEGETPSPSAPTGNSKIPRFSSDKKEQTSVTSVVKISKSPAGDEIVMEEGPDEILVYKRPSELLLSEEKISSSLLPPLMQPGSKCITITSSSGKKSTSSSKHRVNGKGSNNNNINSNNCNISDSGSGSTSSASGSDAEESGNEMDEGASKRSQHTRCEPSHESKQALKLIQEYLEKSRQQQEPAFVTSKAVIQEEWFNISSSRNSNAKQIEEYLDQVEHLSKQLLNFVVNLTDCSGNTAMHYAISHSNFDSASVLLDSKVCDVNKFNKAGYTSLMLVSVSKISNDVEKAVVKRLFQLGDVNLKTKVNGQTALMLASSHGKLTTVKLLLEAGAAVNIQDKDGSTALMCAAEHGHINVVRLLLCHPETDVNLADNDGATALTIAMAAGHKDIGLVIYAGCNLLNRGSSQYSSLRRSSPQTSNVLSLRRTSSFSNNKSSDTSQLRLPQSTGSRKKGL